MVAVKESKAKYPAEEGPPPASIPVSDCITLAEAARILEISRERVRQRTVKGSLKYTLHLGHKYVSRDQVHKLKAELKAMRKRQPKKSGRA